MRDQGELTMKRNTMKSRIRGPLSAAFALAALAAAGGRYVDQTIGLTAGWNAIYLEVTPKDDSTPKAFAAACEEAGFYVRSISCFQPGMGEDLRQIRDNGTLDNTAQMTRFVWINGDEDVSTLRSLTGGTCYLLYCTKKTETKPVTVTGVPALPRFQLTVAEDGALAQVIGVSLPKGEEVRARDYFAEGPLDGVYQVMGTKSSGPTFTLLKDSKTVKGGQAYGANATHNADWSGVIAVSGLSLDDSLTIGPERDRGSFTVRNAGTTNHTLKIELDSTATGGGDAPSLEYFVASLDESAGWTSFTSAFTRELAAGEKVTIGIRAIRRDSSVEQSAVIAVSDLGPTMMRVRFPVVVQPSDFYGSWPQGIWMGEVSLDQVSYYNSSNGENRVVKAGGTVTAPLLLSVKDKSNVTLLQRLVIGSETDKDGNESAVFTINPDKDGSSKAVRRVTCVLMDPDNEKVESESGTFGSGSLTFNFTVEPDSSTNPFRHSWHPDHDGRKSALWGVTNLVSLEWKGTVAATDRTEGEVTWTLKGLRAKCDIICKGRFELKRISGQEVKSEE